MGKLQTLKPRSRRSLIVLGSIFIALILAMLFFRGRGEISPKGDEQVELRKATSALAEKSNSATEDDAARWTADELANGMRPWKPGVTHPWVTLMKNQMGFAYSGPQTAEALVTVFCSGPIYDGKREEMLAHFQRVLARGGVINDSLDAEEYGRELMNRIRDKREENLKIAGKKGLSEEALLAQSGLSIEDFENLVIDGYLKSWAVEKEQYFHASETGESTLNVELEPDGTLFIIRVGAGGRPPLTDAERYNISRHGVAPRGYRLRFMGETFSEELPLDQVPFLSERDVVKKMKQAELEELLVAIPTYLTQPEAVEQSDAMWLSMMDRYDAALEELASRNQIPKPFAGRESPSPSLIAVHPAAPDAVASPEPPIERDPLSDPPTELRDEAALEKAEQRRRIALAFLEALEKAAKEEKVNPAARTLIAARIRELRLMQNPDLLKPPPPSQQPAQESSGEDEEE